MSTQISSMKMIHSVTIVVSVTSMTTAQKCVVMLMSRSYFTEDQKLTTLNVERWSFDDCYTIHDIFHEKGYLVNCVSRIGADKKWHDAFHVYRKDVPRFVEQLFRQRLVAEYQAEGHGMAAIIFSHEYSAETIIDAVSRFQKNNNEETRV